MKRLHNAELRVADLERFPGNARLHADDRLRESVRLGQYKSICVRQMPDKSLVILAGNGTADAMEAEGLDTIWADVIECTDKEAARINLADNRLSDLATDDEDLQADILRSLEGDYLGSGFTESEAKKLLGEEDMPPDGDADASEEYPDRWAIIVELPSEAAQTRLLESLASEGLECRAIMG